MFFTDKNIMKKALIFSLGISLLFSLTGCAVNDLTENVNNTIEQEEKADAASLENDVRNTVTNVATYIATNGNAKDLSEVKVIETGNNTVKIIIPAGKTIFEYQVIGTNVNGETFSFDAATGKYK